MKQRVISICILVVSITRLQKTAQMTGISQENGLSKSSFWKLKSYPEFKYLPSSHVLFAACIGEKRIQMGKKIGCKWQMKPGITAQEHLAEQYKCFEDGGYGKAARTEHGEFCGVLIHEYFRALEQK